ncbi:MAG: cation:proton antiporter, partial [Nitrososphaerales archaeon]
MAAEVDVLRTVVAISLLIFSAKVLATLCQRVKVPAVIGEIAAGIILGPYALGGAIEILGGPVIEFNVLIDAFAEIGGIIILFAAGLEITFAEFRATGLPSLTIGGMGVIIPFFSGYFLSNQLGYGWQTAILFGATLTATSI